MVKKLMLGLMVIMLGVAQSHAYPVHVKGYTKKDGTVVQSYTRGSPGTGCGGYGCKPRGIRG